MSRRVLLVGLSVVLLLGLGFTAANVDWRMLLRHLNAPANPVAEVDWYRPTAEIGSGAGTDIPSVGPEQRTMDDAALDAALRYAVQLDSYALLVAHRGIIQLEYYKDGFSPARQLDSQSLHKPLAAILTMVAVADGALAIDDPLGRFIPQWQGDERGKITVRDVLYMQSGLSEPRFEEKYRNPAYQLFITSRLDDAVLSLPADGPPGEHFRSHYAATQLLQLVLETATGQRYEDFLRERLWSRLGSGAASVRLDRPGGNAQAFCCLQARPRDWLRIGLMLMNEGRYGEELILPPAQYQQLIEPSPLSPNFAMQQIWHGTPYNAVRMTDSRNPMRGLRMSAPFLADDVFYLEGRGGQRVYVVRSRDLVVVRQGEVRMDWDDAAFLNGLLGARQ